MKLPEILCSLATRVIVIFLLCSILYLAIFITLSAWQTKNKSAQYNKNNLQEITKEKSQLISAGFTQIENDTTNMGIWYQKLYRQSGEETYSSLPDGYRMNQDGTITRLRDRSVNRTRQSAIYVAGTAKKSAALYRDIAISEQLDDAFAEVVKNKVVTWAYLVDKNNILRCSPYSDLKAQFETDHDQRHDPFYLDANEENDPDRVAVWTKPYSDYLRTGWMITCSYPIYDEKDRFYGVVCIDLSLNKLMKRYFSDFSIGDTGRIYWLTKDGGIYYQSDMKDSDEQGEIFSKSIFEKGDVGSAKEKAMRKALKSGRGIYEYSERRQEKILFCSRVSDTDTVLLIEVNRSEIVPRNRIDLPTALILILVTILMSFIFLMWLRYNFSHPMNDLVKRANRISEGDYSLIRRAADESELREIRDLDRAFTTMNARIEEYTRSISKRNKEISTILETIEGTLLIVNRNGEVVVSSRESESVSPEIVMRELAKLRQEPHPRMDSEQIILGSEVYRNTYYPICGEGGELSEVVISSDKVTQSVLLEKEVQQMEKMAGIGQFAAAIVHELKNHLAVMKGAAYILKLEGVNKEEVGRIERAADEAEKVIYTLLDYSRDDDERMEMVHVGTFIRQILLLSNKTLIRQNIEVVENIDSSCYIHMGSPEALKVILQNIIINAIQAIGVDGRIEIDCRRDGDNVAISVKDDGEPIPADLREKIFEPFYTTKEDGNGIGLWITRRLTDSLGGTVTATTDENSVTEFTIILPVNTPKDD